MRVEIDFRKTAQENAAYYYEKSKKARRKLAGLKAAINETKRKIEKIEKKSAPSEKKPAIVRKKEWYEKFHWFFSSDGFLVLGGRDSRSNQVLVRRYMDDQDLFFHADIKGGSVVIVKSNGRSIPKRTKIEAAQFSASFSKAFSVGLAGINVYSVKPSQVKTSAKSGEFLPKGGFVILGEREWFKAVPVRVGVSYDKENHRVVSGPESAIKRYGHYIVVVPGNMSKGDIAKRIYDFILKQFSEKPDIDEIMRMLPPGKGKIIQSPD